MEKNIYEKKSMNGLILYFSLPAVLSLLVEIMASVVDTAFAGHLGSMSVDALAAMGLLQPLLNIFTAFQALFAVSTSIYTAKYLNRKSERNSYLLTGIFMTLIVSAAVSAVVCFNQDRLLHLLGAEGQVFMLAKAYLRVQLLSNIFSSMGYTLTACIRAFGFPKVEMLVTGSAVAVNIVFNAVFAFGFRMGFRGLALGTLVSEIFCAVWAALWLLRRKLLPEAGLVSLRHIGRCTLELARLGVAQTIIQAMGGCTGFFLNNSLLVHSGGCYVAVWNLVQNIYTLFLMPIVGITQGVQTIIAYFSGQNQNEKKRKLVRTTVLATVTYGLLGAGCIFTFGGKILSLFAPSQELLGIAEAVIKTVFLTFPLLGVFYTIMTLLEVTGQELKALALIMTRQVFFMLPLVYILPLILPDLPYGIFFTVPTADAAALAVAAVMILKNGKNSDEKNGRQRSSLPADGDTAGERSAP